MTAISYNIIADKIEEAIGNMFSGFSAPEFGPAEYAIFFNPKKHSCWFIVIYFADSDILRTALEQGLCYQIHSYLNNELNTTAETANIEKSISFEYGKRPTAILDIENALGQLIAKIDALKKLTGKADIKICGSCGHDFDKHELRYNLADDTTTPTAGWIMCPEKNCNCFQTWGANFNTATPGTTSKIARFFKKLFK